MLADTLAFCGSVREYASLPEPNNEMDPALIENISGLAPFAGHLFSKGYGWEALKKDMARAALAMAAACKGIDDAEFADILKQNPDNPESYWDKIGKWRSE